MPVVLVLGGSLLAALLGAIARAAQARTEWSNSKRILVLVAIVAAAASRSPQVAVYTIGLITGYVVAAMLEEEIPIECPIPVQIADLKERRVSSNVGEASLHSNAQLLSPDSPTR